MSVVDDTPFSLADNKRRRLCIEMVVARRRHHLLLPKMPVAPYVGQAVIDELGHLLFSLKPTLQIRLSG